MVRFVTDEEFSLSQGDFLVRLGAAMLLGCFWVLDCVPAGLGLRFSVDTVAIGTALMLALNALAYRFRQRNARWFASLLVFDRKFWKASVSPPFDHGLFRRLRVWTARRHIWFPAIPDLAFHMRHGLGVSGTNHFSRRSIRNPRPPSSATTSWLISFRPSCAGEAFLSSMLQDPMVLLAFALCSLTFHGLFSVLKSRTATTFAGLLFFLRPCRAGESSFQPRWLSRRKRAAVAPFLEQLRRSHRLSLLQFPERRHRLFPAATSVSLRVSPGDARAHRPLPAV